MKNRYFFILVVLLLFACKAKQEREGIMRISSPAFLNNMPIPKKYSGYGEDLSPPLEFKGVPGKAKSLVLIVDDPDAPNGNWDHWLVWNIPPDTRTIAEGQAPPGTFGLNDFSSTEYGGPMPPSGTHRYYFKLYALDRMLELPAGASKKELMVQVKKHVVDKAYFIGTYTRE